MGNLTNSSTNIDYEIMNLMQFEQVNLGLKRTSSEQIKVVAIL